MKILARYRDKLGNIAIWEDEADGTRFYLEDEIFQSHGSTKGHSQLDYVKIMEAFLCRAHNVLVPSCGGRSFGPGDVTSFAGSGRRANFHH